MRPLLCLALFLSAPFAVAAPAAPADRPSAPLWAAVDERFAEATEAVIRAALPEPLPPPPLLLPDQLPAPEPEQWAKAPQPIQERLQAGLLRTKERDYGAAIEAFTAVLNHDPRSRLGGEAAYQLAAAHVARVTSLQPDRPQPAIDAAALAVALHPSHPAAPLALFTLAHLYGAIGDTASALAYLRRAATIPDDPLTPRIRYQELRLLEQQGAWIDVFRLAKEIGATFPNHLVATLARLVYLDHALAAGDTDKMVTDYQILQQEEIDWSHLATYRYALFRAALTRQRDDLAQPLLAALRTLLGDEPSAALLVEWGDSHLRHGDPTTALAAYHKVEVEHGRTAMADLARLRLIEHLYPTTPKLGRLRLIAPLRAIASQNERPNLATLARNIWLGLLVETERWEEALARLDRRPLAEPELRQEGWYEPLYGALFSRVWTGRLADRPADLLELFRTFTHDHHRIDTLTAALVQQTVEALAHEGYLEGATALITTVASRADADFESRLRHVELLTVTADPLARAEWDALVAAHDPSHEAPPLLLRLAATGLTLGETDRSPAWAATALTTDPSLATALPSATYRLATYDLHAGRATDAEGLLRALAATPGEIDPWRITTALAEALLHQGREAEAADLLRPALAHAPSPVEAAWARTVIALATATPAGPADNTPPEWAKASATVDQFLAWEQSERRPLTTLAAELEAVKGSAKPSQP